MCLCLPPGTEVVLHGWLQEAAVADCHARARSRRNPLALPRRRPFTPPTTLFCSFIRLQAAHLPLVASNCPGRGFHFRAAHPRALRLGCGTTWRVYFRSKRAVVRFQSFLGRLHALLPGMQRGAAPSGVQQRVRQGVDGPVDPRACCKIKFYLCFNSRRYATNAAGRCRNRLRPPHERGCVPGAAHACRDFCARVRGGETGHWQTGKVSTAPAWPQQLAAAHAGGCGRGGSTCTGRAGLGRQAACAPRRHTGA